VICVNWRRRLDNYSDSLIQNKIEPEPCPEVFETDLDKVVEQYKFLFSKDILAWFCALRTKLEWPDLYEVLLKDYEERMNSSDE
jgi:hypothetical protein